MGYSRRDCDGEKKTSGAEWDNLLSPGYERPRACEPGRSLLRSEVSICNLCCHYSQSQEPSARRHTGCSQATASMRTRGILCATVEWPAETCNSFSLNKSVGLPYVAQADRELEIVLPLPPKCCDYRHMLPCQL
jgi:hypothetical protein